ncbi:hypothetical protein C8J56DRAFT_781949 [Mycena floridula]|nr:hypothetical protein C8J56DRAFT_781949 [Mycena floridula]
MADTLLRFEFSAADTADMRSFSIYTSENQEIYRASTCQSPCFRRGLTAFKFYHPVLTGLSTGVTTFRRYNPQTSGFETAGQVEWRSDTNATVHFGLEQAHIRELRKAKKSTSRSRRFKARGSEYKWKIADDQVNLLCVDSKGKVIANWSQEQLSLQVAPKIMDVLDRIVITCFLNLWIRHLGQW